MSALAAMTALAACTTIPPRDKIPPQERLEAWAELRENLKDEEEGAAEAMLTWWRELVEEPDGSVRSSVIAAAPELLKYDEELIRQKLLDALRSDPNGLVRLQVLKTLLAIKGPEAVTGMREVLTAPEAPPAPFLRERNADVRALAARGLGLLQAEEEYPVLVRSLDDASEEVRREAELSLMKLAGGRKGRSKEEWNRWFARKGR